MSGLSLDLRCDCCGESLEAAAADASEHRELTERFELEHSDCEVFEMGPTGSFLDFVDLIAEGENE